MTVTLNVNGTDYFYPETGDTNWGPEATEWASAVTTGMLQKSGGLFVLLSELDFGASFGVKSVYFKSRTASPASSGIVRLSNLDAVSWRNFADSGDLPLGVNSSDELTFNGTAVGNVVSIADTSSVDLTLLAKVLTADVKLSAASASASNQLVNLTIETDGIKAQIPNSSIIAGIPNASSSVTGLLLNTDWVTFNAKQPAGNYITALTGDVTATGPGSVAATIAAGAVSLAKMANLAANSIIGNNTGSPATPLALTVTQTTAMLNAFVGDSGSGGTKGLVPAPAAGDAAALKYLKADGTWATTPAGSTGVWTAYTPTVVGAGTISVVAMFYRTVGKELQIRGSFLAGSPSASNVTISLPAGNTMDTTVLPAGGANILGNYSSYANGDLIYAVGDTGVLFYNASTTTLQFARKFGGASIMLSEVGTALLNSNATIAINASVPIT